MNYEKATPSRVQRTQLLNLQPAGGHQNSESIDGRSAINVASDKAQPKTLQHIETLEENFALSNLNIEVTSQNPEAAKKKKRGHTHKHLTEAEEK